MSVGYFATLFIETWEWPFFCRLWAKLPQLPKDKRSQKHRLTNQSFDYPVSRIWRTYRRYIFIWVALKTGCCVQGALYLQCLFVASICHHVYLLCVFASHCRLDRPSINAECCHQDLYLNLIFSKELICHVQLLPEIMYCSFTKETIKSIHLLPRIIVCTFQRKQSSLRLPHIIFCTFSKETIFYAAAPHHQTIKDLMTSGATKFIIVAHTLKYKIWSKRQVIFELKK